MSSVQIAAMIYSASAIAAVLGVYIEGRMLRIIRISHPEIWQSLGSPRFSFTDPNAIWSQLKITKFLLLREYRLLSDQTVTRLGDISLVLLLFCIVTFVGYSMVTNGRGLTFTYTFTDH